MNIWVTGSSGPVSSAVLKILKLLDINHLSTNRSQVDITKIDRIHSVCSGVTHIINTAAHARVESAEILRDQAFLSNVIGPECLANYARDRGIRLIHLSTDYVFDGHSQKPYLEDDSTSPLNRYGQTKREGEVRSIAAYPDTCIIRTSRVFGSCDKNDYVFQLLNLMETHEEVFFAQDQINRPTYAKDLAKAILMLINQCGIWHFANRGAVSKYDFASALWKTAKERGIPLRCQRILPSVSEESPYAAVRPKNTTLDTTKIERLLSIRSWEEALTETVL